MAGIEVTYPFIEFYLSLVAYFILHMIFVIASDFVEAFNIPPLNIGIYVDKLAAIRALLMVLSDFIEWGITQKGLKDGGNANQSLLGDTNEQKWFNEWKLRTSGWNNSYGRSGKGSRRWASILSFVGMLVCRIVYLYLLYKSDNKSLSVFITLCLEGFWFGLFQMGFFAIGPEYNAYTSFGIHTMGNIIFFLQVILNHYAKKKPKINCLYRVRVHAWIVVVTSIIALILWICFCLWANAGAGGTPTKWPEKNDVWSPFLLFIVGAFAEDFAVPGVLPFAFLDPEKANLVNYLTPSFFMSGALVTVIFNDWWNDINYKAWSCSSAETKGKPWHALWLLNIPKYIAFFIAMWSIHGTYADLRCIIQSRWRVMLLTMTVVVNRSVLETSGYVGVANWAIGHGNSGLAKAEFDGTMAARLQTAGVTQFPVPANTLAGTNGLNNEQVKTAIANWVNSQYGSSISKNDISATTEGTPKKIKVEIKEGSSTSGQSGDSTANVVERGNSGVKVTINVNSANKGNLNTSNNTDAEKIANKIADFVALAVLAKNLKTDISTPENLTTTKLQNAINNQQTVKDVIAEYIKAKYNQAEVANKSDSSGKKDITATEGDTENTLKVELRSSGGSVIAKGDGSADLTFSNLGNKGVKITIKISNKGNLKPSGTDNKNDEQAKEIAQIIADSAIAAPRGDERDYTFVDFGAFDWIAWHDVTAMFCRFVYGKFAVGYNWTRVSLGYCLPKFRPRHKGFGFGFWWWVGRTLSRAWADTVKDFKADIKCYL